MWAAGEGLPGGQPGRGTKEDSPLLQKYERSDISDKPQKPSYAEATYRVLEDHDSSTTALAISYSLVLCIVLSTAFFIIETLPSVERNETALLWLYAAECVIVIVFSVEYFLRLWSTVATGRQSICGFFFSPMNIIDVLSIMPWYIDLCLMLIAGRATFYDLRFLRTCRIIRMLKVDRYAPQLRMIGVAVQRSFASLLMLLCMMTFALIVFSTLIWLVERGIWDEKQECYARQIPEHDCSPFDSIPGASWWVITTITTVGYGDVFPKTGLGRLVGSVAMVIGILVVAMPTTVLGVQFAEAYEDVVREERRKALLEASLADVRKHDTRSNALAHGLSNMDQVQTKLDLIMKQIERSLLKITADEPRKQAAIKASFGPLTMTALQAMVNSRRFLESYQTLGVLPDLNDFA